MECACVCVLIPFILDAKLVDAPAGVSQGESHPEFLLLPFAVLALTFIARRIQPFLCLVERKVELLVVVVVYHIQRIGCQHEKYYFTRWLILSWSAEQEIK